MLSLSKIKINEMVIISYDIFVTSFLINNNKVIAIFPLYFII